MPHRIIFVILFLIKGMSMHSQVFNQYSEMGFFCGESSYQGDLNPGNPFYMVSLAGGAFYRYNTSQRFSMRFQGTYGQIKAADENTNVSYQLIRNLSFRSVIIEASSIMEFNFFPYETGNPNCIATPYLFAGLGGFFFDPHANIDDEWIALRPLGTEGQGLTEYPNRKKYSRAQICVPFGMGLKMNAGKKISFSLEWGIRKTFTDYLDDVSTTYVDPDILIANHGAYSALLADRSTLNPGRSNIGYQRGNKNNRDWYSILGLSVCFRLSSIKQKCDAYR